MVGELIELANADLSRYTGRLPWFMARTQRPSRSSCRCSWVGARGIPVLDLAGRLRDVGAAVFEVTAIERDGTLAGPDLALLASLVAATGGSVIASAGIRSASDIAAVRALGCAGAIVGRALYDGVLSLEDALAAARSRA